MLTEEYTVRLSAFHGPLDLLLHLIRRAELDISVVSVAEITDQFLRHLERVEEIDVETAGEFLVMAATLVEIKSRQLAPKPLLDVQSGDGPTEYSGADPGAELVRQLLEYKKFRDAAETLDHLREEWLKTYPAGRVAAEQAREPESDDNSAIDLEDVNLFDLVEAFQRIITTVQFDRLGDHKVVYDDTPIAEHQEDVLDRLRGAPSGALVFREVFEGRNRSEMIGLFLAVLELVRQGKISVRQDAINASISLQLVIETTQPSETAAADSMTESKPVRAEAVRAWDDDHIFDDEDDDLDEDERTTP